MRRVVLVGNSPIAMADLLSSREMETLWCLAGRRPASEPPPDPSSKAERLRSRIRAAMLELILRQLETEAGTVAPAEDDLVVLLTSAHQRIRTLGIRLSAEGGTRMSGSGGERRVSRCAGGSG
jgi:hypothetical protein